MGRISNQDKYPLDVQLTGEEFLIGTDVDNITRTFSINQIRDYVGGVTSSDANLNQVLVEGNDGGGLAILNIADPTTNQGAATKAYVDSQISITFVDPPLADVLAVANDANNLTITGLGSPVQAQDAAHKFYVDTRSLPVGGNAGQVLQKTSGTDYDVSWTDNLDNQTAIEVAYDNTTSLLAGTDVQTAIDNLKSITDGLASGGSDGVVSNVVLNGTSLDFTGTGGGFNSSVDLSPISGSVDESADYVWTGNHNFREYVDLQAPIADSIGLRLKDLGGNTLGSFSTGFSTGGVTLVSISTLKDLGGQAILGIKKTDGTLHFNEFAGNGNQAIRVDNNGNFYTENIPTSSVQNLTQVLTEGNDGGGLNMTNLNTVTASTISGANGTFSQLLTSFNLRLTPIPTATNTEDGTMYYDSDTNQFLGRVSGAWVDLGAASGVSDNLGDHIVTQDLTFDTDNTYDIGTASNAPFNIISGRFALKHASNDFWIRETNGQSMVWGKETTPDSAVTTLYSLNSTGTPVDGTDLITLNYFNSNSGNGGLTTDQENRLLNENKHVRSLKTANETLTTEAIEISSGVDIGKKPFIEPNSAGTTRTMTLGNIGVDGEDTINFRGNSQEPTAVLQVVPASGVSFLNLPSGNAITISNGDLAVASKLNSTQWRIDGSYTAVTFDNEAPTVPTSLTNSAQGATTLNYTFSASTDNVAVIGYEYELNDSGSPINIGNVTSFQITGLANSTSYNVKVRSFDAAGNRSAYTTNVQGTTTAASSNLYVENDAASPVSESASVGANWFSGGGDQSDSLTVTSGVGVTNGSNALTVTESSGDSFSRARHTGNYGVGTFNVTMDANLISGGFGSRVVVVDGTAGNDTELATGLLSSGANSVNLSFTTTVADWSILVYVTYAGVGDGSIEFDNIVITQ